MGNPTHASLAAREDLLLWTVQIGAVTADALATRDRCSIASARSRLQAAQRRGLLQGARPLAGAPALYAATGAGLRAAGRPHMEVSRIRASNATHMIACAAVAAALEVRYRDHRVSGERELREQERQRAKTLASAELSMAPGEQPLHRPDLVLWPREPSLPIAVEVELTVKAPRRLLEICTAWARCRCVAGVVYVVSPQARRAVERALEQAHAGGRIALLELGALLDGTREDTSTIERTVPSAT